MQKYIQEIISNDNIQLSQLNDKELSNLSEYCFNIINQFIPISIDEFLIDFHNVSYDIIQEEIEIQEEIKKENEAEEKQSENIESQWYKYLVDHENELLKSLEEVRNLKQQFASCRVKILMTKYQPEQLSQDWFDMRYNMVTASNVGAIIGYCKYNNPKDIILKKCGHSKFKGNKFTFHGQMYEPIATSMYESRFKTTVIEFGLIQHETIPIIGASPDGITTEGIMLEIKCPYTRKLTGNIMDKATLGYFAQIQTQLEVCDLQECHFWECVFDTNGYNDLEDYQEDLYIPENIKFMNIIPKQERPLNYIQLPDDRRSSNGQEKGIFGRIKKQGDKDYSYIYPPFTISTDEQLKWLDDKQVSNQYVYFEYMFWKTLVTSNCIVQRDKTLFDTVFAPKIKDFWKEVELRRKIGCDDLIPKKRKVMDLSSFSLQPKKKKEEFLFVYSSDDED